MKKIAIGIPGGEIARYAIFYDSLMHVKGVSSDNVIQARGANIAENRNGIAERALKMGFDAVWYVDDDQVFGPNTLNALLAHDKDLVSGLYVQREVPFIPQAYEHQDERGFVYPKLLTPNLRGLQSVRATGAGCLLVKRKVFEALEKPWWRLGQVTMEGWGDDVDFCRRVRAAGFEIWCDLDCPVGHQMTGTLWPAHAEGGEWATVLMQGKEIIASWPAAMANAT